MVGEKVEDHRYSGAIEERGLPLGPRGPSEQDMVGLCLLQWNSVSSILFTDYLFPGVVTASHLTTRSPSLGWASRIHLLQPETLEGRERRTSTRMDPGVKSLIHGRSLDPQIR